MRAKLQISSVTVNKYTDRPDETANEQLKFHGVCKSGPYPEDGSDEDNTFARWSPSVGLDITISNPNLFGKFKPGQKFYVDFTESPDSPK